MKRKHRKFLISGTAVVVAGALGIGTLIQTPASAGFGRDDARHRDNRGRKLQREAISDSGTGE